MLGNDNRKDKRGSKLKRKMTETTIVTMMSDMNTMTPKSIFYSKTITTEVRASVCDGKNTWEVDIPEDLSEDELMLNLREQFIC